MAMNASKWLQRRGKMKQRSSFYPMKPFFLVSILVLFVASAYGQQSLGEVARQNRAKKKPTAAVNLDDENMPRKAPPEPEQKTDQDKAASADTDKEAADNDAKKDSAEEQKSKSEEIAKSVESQKKEIAQLQRELDVLQREQKLRAAAYYGDAGTMLRDSAKFADESKKQQEEINSKTQALNSAQQKLADLEEQARKAGAGTSARE